MACPKTDARLQAAAQPHTEARLHTQQRAKGKHGSFSDYLATHKQRDDYKQNVEYRQKHDHNLRNNGPAGVSPGAHSVRPALRQFTSLQPVEIEVSAPRKTQRETA